MKDRSVARGQRGFSLIELLVVITIIGILATTVTVKVIQYVEEARIVKAKAEISQLVKAVGIFRLKSGRLPDSIDELRQPLKGEEEGLIDIGKDPWGHDYLYEKTGNRKFVISSEGPGDGDDATGEGGRISSDKMNDDAQDGGAK